MTRKEYWLDAFKCDKARLRALAHNGLYSHGLHAARSDAVAGFSAHNVLTRGILEDSTRIPAH